MSGRRTFHLTTLGCPKNEVDSDKVAGVLVADGMVQTDSVGDADVVVVNTCAFVEAARQESVDTILALADRRRDGSELVVTGCLAERHGDELQEAMPEIDRVAGFGAPIVDPVDDAGATAPVAVALGPTRRRPGLDLLDLPRPASPRPWAYVKIAEGCDRACGFCAIPSFRGPQRSRTVDSILTEIDQLDVAEVVLVAQDLASFGRDQGVGRRRIVELVGAAAQRVDRVRLLYLYPSDLDDRLIEAVLATGVPYFDLSLQHVSRPLLRRMRRWGDGDRFLDRIDAIRGLEPDAAFRSNFIVGYPGETETDHDRLLDFVTAARLDWCGFFAFSEEEGTHAAGLDGKVAAGLIGERLAELRELQDAITAERRDAIVGREVEVLVDEPGVGRTHREAPEIDGIVAVPTELPVGRLATVVVTASRGPDLEGTVPSPAEAAVAAGVTR